MHCTNTSIVLYSYGKVLFQCSNKMNANLSLGKSTQGAHAKRHWYQKTNLCLCEALFILLAGEADYYGKHVHLEKRFRTSIWLNTVKRWQSILYNQYCYAINDRLTFSFLTEMSKPVLCKITQKNRQLVRVKIACWPHGIISITTVFNSYCWKTWSHCYVCL